MPFDLPPAQTALPNILIVDGDGAMAGYLRGGFAGNGLRFEQVGTASAALRRLSGGNIDLVTLELDLPGANGVDLLRDIRSSSRVPVIVVTGRAAKLASVLCLELGADDYVPKPADPDELNARIRAVLRRREEDAAGFNEPAQVFDHSIVEFAGWRFDMAGLTLSSARGDLVHVTATEAAVLRVFAGNARRPLTRRQINEQVHGDGGSYDDRSVDVLVKKLRAKIAAEAPDLHAIKSVRGVGYIFCLEVRPAR